MSAAILCKRGGVLSRVRSFFHHYLDAGLGAVLLLAGALKGRQLLTDPTVGRATGFPRELLIGAAAFELAFGWWLLAGLYRRFTRWLALPWFTSLAAFALAQALGGAPSCACLGALHTHPLLMFAFDIAAVLALWLWSPKDHASHRGFPATLCLSLLPAAALLGLAGGSPDQSLFAEIDLGDIAQGGQKQYPFQIRNNRGGFVDVAAVETSCPCASIRLQRASVPAGQFLAGNVTLDMRHRSDFVGDLAIEARGSNRTGDLAFALLVRAHVQPASQAAESTH